MRKYTDKDIEEMRRLRFEEKFTYREIGEKYHFSRQRAGQLIGATGILKLKADKERNQLGSRMSKMAQERFIRERFRQNIQIDNETQCWNWVGVMQHDGKHGRMYIGDSHMISSRSYAHYMKYGEIPKHPKRIRYSCKNPQCCNPDHEKPDKIQLLAFDGNNPQKAKLIDKDGKEVIIEVYPIIEIEILQGEIE